MGWRILVLNNDEGLYRVDLRVSVITYLLQQKHLE
jgi:hypothetical protein